MDRRSSRSLLRATLLTICFWSLSLDRNKVTAAALDLYSDKFDYVNATAILMNDRLREQYYRCYMDLIPCATPDSQFFKGLFPEAFVTKCAKCTEKQKQNFDELVSWYIEHDPVRWEAIVKKTLNDLKARKTALDSATTS